MYYSCNIVLNYLRIPYKKLIIKKSTDQANYIRRTQDFTVCVVAKQIIFSVRMVNENMTSLSQVLGINGSIVVTISITVGKIYIYRNFHMKHQFNVFPLIIL